MKQENVRRWRYSSGDAMLEDAANSEGQFHVYGGARTPDQLRELRAAIDEILGGDMREEPASPAPTRRVVAAFRDRSDRLCTWRYYSNEKGRYSEDGGKTWPVPASFSVENMRADPAVEELDPATMEPLAKGVEAKP